jgi:hypothetical protein
MAKRIPAGWGLHFIVHYTPIGTPQQDQTELALQLCDASVVKQEVFTKMLSDLEISIPPYAAEYKVEKTWRADRDMILTAMHPHMHLRGKSFRYEAEYPDGRRETLLNVPAYDFNWQHRYELLTPKRLPAGTVMHGFAVYDNSAANKSNPDPSATVKTGLQSWDEMFNGNFDISVADQDLAAEAQTREQRRSCWMWFGGTCAVLTLAWGLRLWRR